MSEQAIAGNGKDKTALEIQAATSLPDTMTDLVKAIGFTDNPDACLIVAGIINLYIENLRRGQGRVALGPQDLALILRITHMMLAAPTYQEQFEKRPSRER